MNDTNNDNTDLENQTAELEDSSNGDRRHMHRHGHHANRDAYRRRSQRLMLSISLAVSVLLLLLVSIFSIIRISTLSDANDSMTAELSQARLALTKMKPELEQARKDLANLTRGHLPHLRELTPDKVIPVEVAYVKNIVFTSLRTSHGHRHEFRLVVENKTNGLIRPDVRVFVFDHRGVQIGLGEISDRADMVPGESRSYSGTIDRFIDEEPRYFYVWMRTKNTADNS